MEAGWCSERGERAEKKGRGQGATSDRIFFRPAGPFPFPCALFRPSSRRRRMKNLSFFITGAPVAARFWWPSLLPGSAASCSSTAAAQRTTIVLGAGAATRRGGLIFTRGRERGRLPVVDFGVPSLRFSVNISEIIMGIFLAKRNLQLLV